MYYYIYKIEYNATNTVIVIIKSDPQSIAGKLKKEFPNARYYHLIGKTLTILI